MIKNQLKLTQNVKLQTTIIRKKVLFTNEDITNKETASVDSQTLRYCAYRNRL